MKNVKNTFWQGGKVSVNGTIVEPEMATVSIFDRGFLFGESVFETLRVDGGEPFAFEEHLERIVISGDKIGFTLPWSAEVIEGHCRAALRESGLEQGYMRIIGTRGMGPIGLDPGLAFDPQLFVIVLPLPEIPETVYQEGITAVLVSVLRNLKKAVDPAAKTGNYMNSVLAAQESRSRGADEAIMLNVEGHVAEGSSSNVFALIDGVWVTPPLEAGILSGITRKVLLELCQREEIPTEIRVLLPEALRAADEMFLCSSVKELVPVVSLDDQSVGQGVVGENYRRLRSLYREEVRRRCGS